MSKIALVEDHQWYAAQQQRLLGAAGYQVAHATTPQGGMELIEMFRPDVLILDMLLKDNTAMVLLNELQSNHETMQLPVIVYTAQATMLSQEALKYYGVIALLDKTVMQPDDTLRVLRRLGI